MEFGKITENLEDIDFSFPESHPGTIKVLGEQKAKKLNVYVGCPIWSDEKFVGKIYPQNAKPANYVRYYSKQFNSIELNTSHYQELDPGRIKKWVDATTADFKFFPKVHQSISHTPLLKYNAQMMREFLTNVKHFQKKLGMPFLQLPERYDSSNLNDLLTFLDEVAMSGFAIELRHASWFSNETVLKQVCNYFYGNNITFLILDCAGRRDVMHQRLTTKTAFIRFLANDLHDADQKRIQDWVIQLDNWIENGLEEIYFFVHTPSNELMPEIVNFFIKAFSRQTGIKLEPAKITKPEDTIRTLF